MLSWFLVKIGLVKPKVPEKKKPNKPGRITVVLSNGDMVTHYAGRRSVSDEGMLTLYYGSLKDDGTIKGRNDLVAEYAPGSWVSISAGKRMWRKKNGHSHFDQGSAG